MIVCRLTPNRTGHASARSLRLPAKEVKRLAYPVWFALHAQQFKLGIYVTLHSRFHAREKRPDCLGRVNIEPHQAVQFSEALPIPLLQNSLELIRWKGELIVLKIKNMKKWKL